MALSPEDIQLIYKIFVVFLYSFFTTLWGVPYVIEKLRKYGYVTKDMYKKGTPSVPVMGGIAMLIGILVALSLSQVLLSRIDLGSLIIFHFIILVYALYGTVDDLLHFKKRYDKIFALLVLSLPIAALVHDTTVNLLFFEMDVGLLYPLAIVPIYIMVVANLINVHAGYNGLTQGLSIILLVTAGVQSYRLHETQYLIFLVPVLGAALAFYPSTMYPAKILPGNVGDFLVGAALGAFLVLNTMLWFGVVILIPHIVNFLMDSYTLLLRRRKDDKFGSIREDGTIQAPRGMELKSLKFLIVSKFRLTEQQAVLWLYAFTLAFCLLGLAIF